MRPLKLPDNVPKCVIDGTKQRERWQKLTMEDLKT